MRGAGFLNIILAGALALLLSDSTYSAEGDKGEDDAPLFEVRRDQPGPPSYPVPFAIGERLTFHVAFGVVPAGKAVLEVLDTVQVNDQWSWAIRSTARSAKGFDWVFKVRDTIRTWMDTDSLYSHHFHKTLQEGFFEDEKEVKFELADSLARWWDDGMVRSPRRVEPRVQDVLSAGYRTRVAEMEVGDTLVWRTHDVKKTYDLLVIVHGRDTVQTLAGEFDCFVCEPVLKSGGLFNKERKAHVYVWMTADERRLPIMMTSKVSFGSFTAELEDYVPGEGKRGLSESEVLRARDGGRPDLGPYGS